MEEINIFLNNTYKIFYLDIFDDSIKDENNFKIGMYKLMNNELTIEYVNGNNIKYYYFNEENNIKRFHDKNNNINNLNSDKNLYKNELKLELVHKDWIDSILLNKDNLTCERLLNKDKANYKINKNELILEWKMYDKEIFEFNDFDNKYYLVEQEINNKIIFIKNYSWEDEIILYENNICIRQNINKDKGTYIENQNYLTIN